MATIQDVHELLQLLELTHKAVHTIIGEWAKTPSSNQRKGTEISKNSLPGRELFEARRTLISATGKFVELVASPSERLLEVSSQYNEARCLHIAASLRIADILAANGESGVTVEELSTRTGVQSQKLALAGNEPLRAYIVMFALDLYTASDALPRTLLDPKFGHSYSVTETAFQKALNTNKERWNWLEEETTPLELQNGGPGKYPGPFGPELSNAITQHQSEDKIKRPEHSIFGLAMLGGGRITGVAHLFGNQKHSLQNEEQVSKVSPPQTSLGQASVRPQLSTSEVESDRGPVLEQAQKEVWPTENAEALAQGRVQFITHNFFDKNFVEGADVYWLRYILHDWSDDYSIQILSALRQSMGPHSRVLICDQVMNTTAGFQTVAPAPSPLPASCGYHTHYSHQRDISMMSIINGIERIPGEFKNIIEKAGLELSRIYDCRSQVSLVECTLPRTTADVPTNGQQNGH
ncbi:O-methyltransferase, putative [Talaromyces stipitatus ATCC 10500]|uniref:O-methyltransferase, putative n=1 Tax=Talaromyces stipitatus (strain ATCC 10500 / CBS 375.48 / QM 6759 / NRRL 1006) TaxID=441959 RepID=B8LZ12_TALSN|nr:O-methyltransferase, putative [Talaromyces stipitatus ATCC 10500]EED21056.1 O-methyltransferase, putative [Talaromyces stipitatus ATCC 10500]